MGRNLHSGFETPTLTILPSLRAKALDDGRIIITKKFLSGVEQYKKEWRKNIKVLFHPTEFETGDLDAVSVHPSQLPFDVKVVNFRAAEFLKELFPSSLVLASLDDFLQVKVVRECLKRAVPCIYISEYSLKTRLQIVSLNTKNNILLRGRRFIWEINQERLRRRVVRLANGLQCNGTPTYNEYREINAKPILFFDSRIPEEALASMEQITSRIDRLKTTGKLNLAFSGRLVKEKGADHLIPVAIELRRRQLPFKLFICGNGVLADSIRQKIKSFDLANHVEMLGTLDFETQWVPFVTKNVDLFICCHPQGDPSCTYLETLACGVPIVGYANEALAGLEKVCDACVTGKVNNWMEVVDKICELSKDIDRIGEMSGNALDFARKHTLEKTFSLRMAHIEDIFMSYKKSVLLSHE